VDEAWEVIRLLIGAAGATPHPTSLREATFSRKGRRTMRRL